MYVSIQKAMMGKINTEVNWFSEKADKLDTGKKKFW